MTTKKKPVAKSAEEQTEKLEIVFDISRFSLMETLDLMEMSGLANERLKKGEKPLTDEEGIKFVGALKRGYVSSSRPLTGADLNLYIAAFWEQFNAVGSDPN